MEHTRASFVLGHHQEQASVVCCKQGDPTLLVTDLTPFHPQSHLWPDQPGDVGTVRWEGGEAAVGPCRMGAISPEGELFVDTEIPVKRGADGWAFVVVHPLAGSHHLAIGRVVTSPTSRGGGLGHRLLAQAVRECEARWPAHSIWLGAQAHLQGFYGQHGFVAEGEGYLEDDIPHMGMRREPA